MVDYPRSLELEPITDWPGELTVTREIARFRTAGHTENGKWVAAGPTKLAITMRELQTEIDALKGSHPVLAIAILREDLRLDGKLRAGAKPWHPGVILSFETKRGAMRYANDRFTRWEDNLRGIVKELEALRGITRWVNNGGQQYGGFLAIEAATAMPAGFSSFTEAAKYLADIAGLVVTEGSAHEILSIIRAAQRKAHPDLGGDPDVFQRVNLAEQYIRDSGAIR